MPDNADLYIITVFGNIYHWQWAGGDCFLFKRPEMQKGWSSRENTEGERAEGRKQIGGEGRGKKEKEASKRWRKRRDKTGRRTIKRKNCMEKRILKGNKKKKRKKEN